MKKLNIVAALFAALTLSQSVNADMDWTLCPYLGVDAQVRHMDFKRDFGGGLFKKNYAQGNVYGGLRLNDYLGIEVGYEQSNRKSASVAGGAGSVEFGFRIPANVIIFSTNTFKIRGPHASLVGFIPFCVCDESFDFFASVGVAQLRAKFSSQITGFLDQFGFNPVNSSQLNNFLSQFKRHKNVLKANVGLQYWMTEQAGLRLAIGWENTSKFKNIRGFDRFGFTGEHASLKDSFNYGMGIFWQF